MQIKGAALVPVRPAVLPSPRPLLPRTPVTTGSGSGVIAAAAKVFPDSPQAGPLRHFDATPPRWPAATSRLNLAGEE